MEAYLEDNRSTLDEICEGYDECTEECPAYEFCHSKGMTREEAIENLKDILAEATETDNSVCYVTSDDADALKMAIQALEREPKSGEGSCSDDIFATGICSSCGWDSGESWEFTKKYFKYCPDCGARLVGVE